MAAFFFWANFRNMATKNKIGILFYFVKFFDFSSVKIRGKKIAKFWGKKKNLKKRGKKKPLICDIQRKGVFLLIIPSLSNPQQQQGFFLPILKKKNRKFGEFFLKK